MKVRSVDTLAHGWKPWRSLMLKLASVTFSIAGIVISDRRLWKKSKCGASIDPGWTWTRTHYQLHVY